MQRAQHSHSPGGVIDFTLQPSNLKKEGPSRMQSDSIDSEKIRNKLLTWINPLNPESHPHDLINIMGCIAPDSVNVHKSLILGIELMKDYEQG